MNESKEFEQAFFGLNNLPLNEKKKKHYINKYTYFTRLNTKLISMIMKKF